MPIVAGIDAFRDAMAGFEDKYVLIGGGACSLLFEGAPVDFRLTKDLDVIVMAASDDVEFGKALWSFVRAGGYTCGIREDGSTRYYRFLLPEVSETSGDDDDRFPAEIELFSHASWPVGRGVEIVPVPFDGDLSSLSAILLDEDYYVAQIESLFGRGESAESFLSNGCVAIEEVEFDDQADAWDVSVGFFRPWNRMGGSGLASTARAISPQMRTIKTVVIDNRTGEVVDYRPYALVTTSICCRALTGLS